ncbi:MAG: hypothetical protein RIQ72_685 [Candidatus Parcubacteria bacterium]|jgi:hypothetical protein
MKKTKYILALSLICVSVFSVTRFVLAENWTSPTANPPANNAPAPINVSDSSQTKSGDFMTDGYLRGATLRSFGRAILNYATAAEMSGMPNTFLELALAVKGKIGASHYCNERGESCFTPDQVTGGGVSTGGVPVGAIVLFANSCPTGWSEFTALQGKMPIGVNAVYPIGSTGGNSQITLSVNQLPSHSHDYGLASGGNIGVESVEGGAPHEVIAPKPGGRNSTLSTGGGSAINIMNPYKAVIFCQKD